MRREARRQPASDDRRPWWAAPSAEPLPAAPILPRWFEALVAALAGAVLGVAVTGLILAIPGVFAGWAAGAGGVAGAAAAAVAVVTTRRPGAAGAAGHLGAALAVGLAVAVAAMGAWQAGQHVVIDRDPAVYATTARWLARTGQLPMPVDGVAATAPDLDVTALGFDDVDGDRVHPQFLHGLPVLAATGYAAAGAEGIFLLPPVLAAAALLALYALAVRWLPPGLALAACAAVAASLPFMWLSRDLYSELPVMLLAFSGWWLLDEARRRSSWVVAAAAGLALGATLLFRIDALAVLLPLPVWVAAELTAGTSLGPDARRTLRRRLVATTIGALAAASLGAVDGLLRSPGYLLLHRGQLLALLAALAAAVVAATTGWWVARRSTWSWNRRAVATGAALGLIGAVAVLWAVRPLVEVARGPLEPSFEEIQRRQGLPVDGTLRHSEDSVRWLAWYLGPHVVAVGTVGAAVALRRAVLGWRHVIPALGTSLFLTATFLWRPSAAPDHPWVMRRFVPFTLTALVVLAAAVAAWAVGRWWGRLAAPRRVAHAVTAVLLLAVPILTTLPVAGATEQRDFLDQVIEPTCEALPPDAVVVVLEGATLEVTLPPALRSWCGVVAVGGPPSLPPERAAELAREWSERGLRLYLLAADRTALLRSLPDGVDPLRIAHHTGDSIERTFTERPDDLVEQGVEHWLAPVTVG